MIPNTCGYIQSFFFKNKLLPLPTCLVYVSAGFIFTREYVYLLEILMNLTIFTYLKCVFFKCQVYSVHYLNVRYLWYEAKSFAHVDAYVDLHLRIEFSCSWCVWHSWS
jgi:hypothetical protein